MESFQWQYNEEQWTAKATGGEPVEWVESGWRQRLEEYNILPIEVTIDEGQALYVPSLWYHEVKNKSQGITMALNTWYDMDFESVSYLCNLNAAEGLCVSK